MTKIFNVGDQDPANILKSIIKMVRANYSGAASTDEIIYDNMRSSIETTYGVTIPRSVEGFKFNLVNYESPLGCHVANMCINIFVGGEEEINEILTTIKRSELEYVGEWGDREILGGFISTKSLQNTDADFIFFAEDLMTAITYSNTEACNPWELYNLLATFFMGIIYNKDEEAQFDLTSKVLDIAKQEMKSNRAFSVQEIMDVRDKLMKEFKKLHECYRYCRVINTLITAVHN